MRDNRGFSLIELVIAVAILAVIAVLVVTFLMTSTGSYKNVSSETELQFEAQLAINQIHDLVVDANKSVKKQGANSLLVENNDVIYEISYDPDACIIYLTKIKAGNSETSVLSEYVTSFHATVDETKGRVSIGLTMKRDKREAEITDVVTLRNYKDLEF